MKIAFSHTSPEDILERIQGLLQQRKLGSLVSLRMEGSVLHLTISKFGTSRLSFVIEQAPDQDAPGQEIRTVITLRDKKIPLTHRALEKDLLAKFTSVVQQSGGEILEEYQV